MKCHFIFLALFCLQLLVANSETLNEKKGFQITGSIDQFKLSRGADVNGDGYSDFLLSMSFDLRGSNQIVYLVYGGPNDKLNDFEIASMSPKQGIKVFLPGGEQITEYSLLDVNKDGYADIVLQTRRSSPHKVAMYVIFGGPSLSDIKIESMTSTQGFKIKGFSGACVNLNPAGDINGDGYEDIIFSDNWMLNNLDMSVVWVIYGGANLHDIDLQAMSTSQGIKISYPTQEKGLSFAYKMSAAGDVNNDGYDDLFILLTKPGTKTSSLFVVYGGPALTNLDLTQMRNEQGFIISVKAKVYELKLSQAGDVNKDGYADLLFGITSSDDRGNGKVYIIYGGKALKNLDVDQMTDSQGIIITGQSANEEISYFGRSLSPAGDFNKDGYDDVIIGSMTKDNLDRAAYIVYGGKSLSSFNIGNLTSTHGFKIADPNSQKSRFADEMRNLGDINKDGFDDVIIEGIEYLNPNSRKVKATAYVVFGRS